MNIRTGMTIREVERLGFKLTRNQKNPGFETNHLRDVFIQHHAKDLNEAFLDTRTLDERFGPEIWKKRVDLHRRKVLLTAIRIVT